MMTGKKTVLGRGLGALIEDNTTKGKEFEGISYIPLNRIEVNPYQPRIHFEEDSLKELAESIATIGIIQPITVRRVKENLYQLISGERRVRASKLAGLEVIPAFVRDANDQGMLEMALIENIQREDLDAIEVSVSYQRLIDECKLTQEELSSRVGKQRSTVSNYLRLLKLPPEIQIGIRQHKISMGHARALVNVEDAETQVMIYEQILKYDFSVRRVEDIVRELSIENNPAKKRKPQTNPEIKKICKELSQKYSCKVDVKRNLDGKGRLIFTFTGETDYQHLIKKLGKS